LEDLSIGAFTNFADQLVLGSNIEHFFGANHAFDEEVGVLRVFVALLLAHRRSHLPRLISIIAHLSKGKKSLVIFIVKGKLLII
jgi:hypothetical protein